MRILICIDDTDNIESRGTGELAMELSEIIKQRGWGSSSGITRHQLFVHPDIPYTSHNSSMCFEAKITDGSLADIIISASRFLENESAPGSDPGLSIVNLDKLQCGHELINFGHRAKTEVLTKQDAYCLAQRLEIHLSEHGGTGQGVVGALAGVGLRLSGNDGRFKGTFKTKFKNEQVKVADILASTPIELVKSVDGKTLKEEDNVYIEDKLKAVLLDGKCVLLVDKDEKQLGTKWKACSKANLRNY